MRGGWRAVGVQEALQANAMVGMAGAALRRAADVYEWLARRQREEVGVESVMDAIRSVCGSVPLGGSDGSRAATSKVESSDCDEENAFWQIVLTCCDLPASASVEQRKSALQDLSKTLEKTKRLKTRRDDKGCSFTWQAVAAIRDQYYAERKAFFLVRIELLRIALFVEPEEHPNFDVVEEIVDELLKEGLLDALLDEFTGRQQSVANRPNFFDLPGQLVDVSYYHHQALQAWEVQYLEEEALLRQLLLLTLYVSKERVDFRKAIQTTKAFHVRLSAALLSSHLSVLCANFVAVVGFVCYVRTGMPTSFLKCSRQASWLILEPANAWTRRVSLESWCRFGCFIK